MNIEQYEKFHQSICNRARELSLKKNHDYAASHLSPKDKLAIFKNFLLVEKMDVCSTRTGFLVRLCDKFQRLCHILKEGSTAMVISESAEDTILDIINYVILLAAYLQETGPVPQDNATRICKIHNQGIKDELRKRVANGELLSNRENLLLNSL